MLLFCFVCFALFSQKKKKECVKNGNRMKTKDGDKERSWRFRRRGRREKGRGQLVIRRTEEVREKLFLFLFFVVCSVRSSMFVSHVWFVVDLVDLLCVRFFGLWCRRMGIGSGGKRGLSFARSLAVSSAW